MGKVLGYNIYSKRFPGNYNPQKITYLDGKAQAQVELPEGDQKIWITAFTSKGEGPKSNERTIFADDIHHGMFVVKQVFILISSKKYPEKGNFTLL